MTIYEVLENARYNLNHNGAIGAELAKSQLNNVIYQLDQGKGLYAEYKEDN